MKKIFLSVDPSDIEKINKHIFGFLSPLFKQSSFKERIFKVRDKFNLPGDGIRRYIGVDEKNPDLIKRNKKTFLNEMELIFSAAELKNL